jgi:tol-pal system protein YbgF
MRQWLYLAPVAASAATGCFASKSDIVLLQDEIRSMRASQLRADSARKLQQDSAIMLSRRTIDSVRALSQRFGAFQANINGELFDIGKQLITLQELAGMSSRRITDLRAELENRSQAPVPPSDTAAPPAPGPAQMFQLSYDLLRRRSYSAARTGFEEMLRRYPDFDEASAAVLYIAQSFEEEKRTAEADSVYSLLVTRYPRSKDAPTALYKYGMSQLRQRKNAAARAAFNRVVSQYPNSTEADLAREAIRTIPR